MKKIGKIVAAIAFLFVVTAMVPVVSKAAMTKPVNLKQTEATENGVKYSWDPVEGADGYLTSWSPDQVNWTKPEAATAAEQLVTGLQAGQSYYVQVVAVDMKAYDAGEEEFLSEESDVFEVVTAPDAAAMRPINKVEQTTSIALSWSAVPGATSYILKDGPADTAKVYGTTTQTNFTMSNLTPNTTYALNVFPVRTSASGYQAMNTYLSTTLLTAVEKPPVVIPAPSKASTANFGLYKTPSMTSNDTGISFFVKNPDENAVGYEVEIFKVKGGKKVKTVTSQKTISDTVYLSKNVAYKYRIRYFTLSNGQKLYGDYSGYRYFCLQKASAKTEMRTKKIRMKWGKVAGASGYTVYVSKNSKKGFKKVKSLGAKAKKIEFKGSGKLKLKKGQTYYVKLVAKIKDGGKTVSNDAQRVFIAY